MKKDEFCESRGVFEKEIRNLKNNVIEAKYYKAYEKRYSQVYVNNMLWSAKENTPDVVEIINQYKINKKSKILDLGCSEGSDSICLLDARDNVMAVDYSSTVIEKCYELFNYEIQWII